MRSANDQKLFSILKNKLEFSNKKRSRSGFGFSMKRVENSISSISHDGFKISAKKGNRLSVFKGREAKLNCAIFKILAVEGPQTIYEIHKRLRKTKGFSVYYGSINRRFRVLEEKEYLKKSGMKISKNGFQTETFDLTFRAYLACFLNAIDLDLILSSISEESAEILLANLVNCLSDMPDVME